jgi:DHA1 family bicyclomycin/chloramphenicol resistance-like MFS transporter
VFLLGMGILNPLATAIALQPFGQQAGAASALLGFLQMGCAATAITLGSAGGLTAYSALGIILSASLTASLLVFRALRSTAPAAA